MLPYLPIEIINIILTFRPRHPLAILVKNNVKNLFECYLYKDYEESYELNKTSEVIDIITKIQKDYLKPVSNYRRALLYNKEFFEKQIIFYSENNNIWSNAYIKLCNRKLLITNKLIDKFTLYKDIELLYKFNSNFFLNLDMIIVDWIIKQHNII